MKNKKKNKKDNNEYSFKLCEGEDPKMALMDARFYSNSITWKDLQNYNKEYGNDIDSLFPGYAVSESKEIYIQIH